jgi:hypothetical protein
MYNIPAAQLQRKLYEVERKKRMLHLLKQKLISNHKYVMTTILWKKQATLSF